MRDTTNDQFDKLLKICRKHTSWKQWPQVPTVPIVSSLVNSDSMQMEQVFSDIVKVSIFLCICLNYLKNCHRKGDLDVNYDEGDDKNDRIEQ